MEKLGEHHTNKEIKVNIINNEASQPCVLPPGQRYRA